MQIRLAYAPTRFSAEHLRSAYEVLVPLVERSIGASADALVPARDERRAVQQQQQQRRRTR